MTTSREMGESVAGLPRTSMRLSTSPTAPVARPIAGFAAFLAALVIAPSADAATQAAAGPAQRGASAPALTPQAGQDRLEAQLDPSPQGFAG
jgi:hypothetical protein